MQRCRQTVGLAAMQWECNAVILCPAAGRVGGAAWNGSGQPEQMGSSWSYQEAIAIDGKFTRTALAKCWCVFWHKARKPLSFCFSILCPMCHNILHRLFISHLKKNWCQIQVAFQTKDVRTREFKLQYDCWRKKRQTYWEGKAEQGFWWSDINLVR